MKTKIIFLTSSILFGGVYSFADATEAFNKIPMVAVTCKELQNQATQLLPAGKDFSDEREPVVLSQVNFDKAIKMLPQLPAPEKGDVEIEIAALDENPEKNLGRYIQLQNKSCQFVRLHLTHWIFDNAKRKKVSSAKLKSAKESVKKSLLARRYPTYLDAIVDIGLIKTGAEKKFWKVSAVDLSALEKLQGEIKASGREINKEFAAYPALSANDDKLTPEQSLEALVKKPEFQKIKHVFVDEAKLAVQYQKQIAEIAGRLN